LVASYSRSQYYYAAREKVNDISRMVRRRSGSSNRTLIHSTPSVVSVSCVHIINSAMLQKGTVLDSGGSQASFLMQACTLTKRSFINMSRDFGYYWLRLLIYLLVTVCIGTIYLDVGTKYTSILVIK
jgi:hypothetical protein